MISTFKSLSKGTQRIIIILGIVIALFVPPNTLSYNDSYIVHLIVTIICYLLAVFTGLWIYDGYKSNGESKSEEKFQSKNALIRYLIKKRLQQNQELNLDEDKINSMQGMRLAGMPESTIVAIVELYAKLKETDLSDKEIFQQFEQMRSGSGKMPSPLTLNSYINYRLSIEHRDSLGLTEEFTSDAVKICLNHFNFK